MKLRIHPFRDVRAGAYRLACPDGLEARTGEITFVRGDSGSGKSLLLQVLSGYRALASDGEVFRAELLTRDGAPPLDLPGLQRARHRIAYLPQASVLRPELRPDEAVRAWCKILRTRSPDAADTIEAVRNELMERLFSPEERGRLFGPAAPKIAALSGGQRRRLDALLTLCSPAEILLLDEPDSGLDASRREALFDACRHLASRYRRILIVVSHFSGDEPGASSAAAWRVVRDADRPRASVRMEPGPEHPPVDMSLHPATDEGGDLRLDHLLVYLRMRIRMLTRGRILAGLGVPVGLMACVRLAVFPTELADGPSMALLFFFCVTCFWLGTIQATGFWSDEQDWFQRECRQGASSFAYLLSFCLVLSAVLLVQGLAAAAAARWLDWSAILSRSTPPPGDRLYVGVGRLWGWGAWAALNGMVAGLAVGTLQYRVAPRRTSPVTAQFLALCITLAAIVFSFPIIGSRAYAELTTDPHAANRMQVARDALRQVARTDVPALAVVLAELPLGLAPSFHGLWFQAERPARYRVEPAVRDNMQKRGLPEGAWNSLVLCAALAGVFASAHRLKQRPVEA